MRNKVLLYLIKLLIRMKKAESTPPATLRDGWLKMYEAVEGIDDVQYYLAAVDTFKAPQVFIDFYIKALFNATAARDELKIHMDQIEEQRMIDERTRQIEANKNSTGNNTQHSVSA